MIKKSKFTFLIFVIAFSAFISFSILTESCADNPTSLGLNLINPSETLGVKVFDSFRDTMVITSTITKINVNTSSSVNLIVGKNQNYNSMGLVKFTSISANYDTAVVASAVLKLKYHNYYFPVTNADSLGTISFNIYTVQQYHDFGQMTLDSINSNSFGTTSVGNYSGAPAHDSTEADIPLDLTMIHNWFEYAHNPSYSVQNYGIVLSPNNSSNTLKGFYSSTQASGLKPLLQVTFSSNHDTLNFDQTQTLFLATGNLTQVPGSTIMISGMGYDENIKFDLSKLPPKAVINDAQLILSFDQANSIFTNQSLVSGQFNVLSYLLIDTLHNHSLATADQTNANITNYQFLIHVTSPFQKWLNGPTNYGLLLEPSSYKSNFDQCAFFNEMASDPSKRPHVIIRYSLRVP